MDVTINRLDPNVRDPVESRRRAAGRLVRIAYATAVFGVLGFFIVYFGSPLVYLSGPGTVHPRDMWFRFPLPCRSTR
jgi:HlyD family secretion protein